MTLSVGELFAGIGGIGLGFERAGFQVGWQVEKDEYANRVLRKHWPNVRRWGDVRTFPPEPVDDWRVDVIAGGFPCQDISNAGQRAGIDGERSGLWGEFARIVGVLRPRYVVVENVAALLVRGMGRVCGDLAACGYDAEWRIVPAGGPGGVGAPHRRERVFVVGYASGSGREPARGGLCEGDSEEQRKRRPANAGNQIANVPDAAGVGRRQAGRGKGTRAAGITTVCAGNVPDAAGVGMEGDGATRVEVAQAQIRPRIFRRDCTGTGKGYWEVEPDVGRLVDGVPNRVDRLRCLGNAVVPAVAQYVAESILEFDNGEN